MLDDDNSKEIEAALREDEELDIPDGVTSEEWKQIQEEAQAEEEFIADREDTVKPLVFTKKDGTAIDEPKTRSIDASDGVLGSGELETEFGEPINNEHELRKESMEEDKNLISNTDDAAESVADVPAEDSGIGNEVAAEPVSADAPVDAAPTSEPEAEPAPAAENPNDPSVVAAPSADVPAATDTPTPIPGGMPMSPVSADASVAATGAEPKKKKKTGLIIGLVVFFLLIIGGGIAAFLLYNAHEAPEQQVKDAISNVLNAKTLGATKVAAIESGKLPHIKMSVSSESAEGVSMSAEFALKGNSAYYIKAGGLSELGKNLAGQLGSSGNEETGEFVSKLVDSIIKPIDNTWIVLSIDDAEGKAAASCIQESIDGISSESFRKKMSDNFDKYPFIAYKKDSKIENRDGINYYEVEIDEDLQKKFSEAMEDAEELKSFESCMEKNGIGGSTVKKTAARLSATKEEDEDIMGYDDAGEHDSGFSIGTYAKDKDTVIKLGITSWSHELQAIEMVSTDKEGKKDTANFTFKTIDEGDVKDAKTVEQLIEELSGAVKNAITEYAETYAVKYCKEAERDYGEEFKEYFGTQSECVRYMKDQVNSMMEGFDVSSLMGGLGGAVQTRI